ncbi:uncharacterized protein [Clytia hemisphaerica]|uniref:Uncharacterized protein n=2 Tax=Clytia hemisphaerica TaxID=252671 RepID=A0A7M5V0K6_9CNID
MKYETIRILFSLGNYRKRQGSQGANWKKKVTYIENEIERKRRSEDLFSQIISKMEYWFTLCKAPASILAFFDNDLHYYGTSNKMKDFCDDPIVKKRFAFHMRHEVEDVDNDKVKQYPKGTLVNLYGWKKKGSKEKQKIVRSLVKPVESKGCINWKTCPLLSWWPSDVPFKNPTGTPKMTVVECDKVITSFVYGELVHLPEDLILESEERYSNVHCRYLLGNISRMGTSDIVSLLNKLQNVLPEHLYDMHSNDINLWTRNSKEVIGFEPVNVSRDGDSFYRTISMLYYGEENSFDLIKLGIIAFGIVNAEQLSSILNICSQDLRDSLFNKAASSDGDQGSFEYYSASGFTQRPIDLRAHEKWKENTSETFIFKSPDQSKKALSILKSGVYQASKVAKYYTPLQPRRVCPVTCAAMDFCVAPTEESLNFKCQLCGFFFHKMCVFPSDHRNESCGCHRIPIMNDKNSLSWIPTDLPKWFEKYLHQIKNNIVVRSAGTESPSFGAVHYIKDSEKVDALMVQLNHAFPGFCDEVIRKKILPEAIIYVSSRKESCSRLCIRRLLKYNVT